jgi:hypothetical protein
MSSIRLEEDLLRLGPAGRDDIGDVIAHYRER